MDIPTPTGRVSKVTVYWRDGIEVRELMRAPFIREVEFRIDDCDGMAEAAQLATEYLVRANEPDDCLGYCANCDNPSALLYGDQWSCEDCGLVWTLVPQPDRHA